MPYISPDVFPYIQKYTDMLSDSSLSNSRDENFVAQCKRLTYNTLTKLLGTNAMSGKSVTGVYKHLMSGKSLDTYSSLWSSHLNGGRVNTILDLRPGTIIIKEGHSGEIVFWLDKDRKLTNDPTKVMYFGMRESAGDLGQEKTIDKIDSNKNYYVLNEGTADERYFELESSGQTTRERLNNKDNIVVGNNGVISVENIEIVRDKNYVLDRAVYLSPKGIMGTSEYQEVLSEKAKEIYDEKYNNGQATIWSGGALKSKQLYKDHELSVNRRKFYDMKQSLPNDYEKFINKGIQSVKKNISINIEHKKQQQHWWGGSW